MGGPRRLAGTRSGQRTSPRSACNCGLLPAKRALKRHETWACCTTTAIRCDQRAIHALRTAVAVLALPVLKHRPTSSTTSASGRLLSQVGPNYAQFIFMLQVPGPGFRLFCSRHAFSTVPGAALAPPSAVAVGVAPAWLAWQH